MNDQPVQFVVDFTMPREFCPWAAFDPAWYQATYMRSTGQAADPFAHYTETGAARGHSPNPFFDEAWYVSRYADVRDALRHAEFASGFAHYCATGHRTHDPHWLFGEALYRGRRPDLTDAALRASGLCNGYHHYLIAGQNENVSGSPFFDPALFIEATGIVDRPFSVLLGTPALTALNLSPFFDQDWYLAMHPDAAAEVAALRYSSALHHFLANPEPERFPGSADFDEAYYRRLYPDIGRAIATGDFRSGFQHFVQQGRFENRTPSRWFDPAHYAAHRVVIEDLGAGRAQTAFDHYLTIGRALGLSTLAPVQSRRPADPAEAEGQGKDAFARMAHLLASTPPPAGGGGPAIAFPVLDDDVVPDVSVVIAAYNQFDLTLQTLMSLSTSTGVRFEVILVDNGSTDEVRRIEAHVAGLLVLRNTLNRGFLHASNQGIAASRGRHVLLLNNDVLLLPNTLAHAWRRLDSDASIGAVGGKIVRTHGMLQEAGSILFRDGSAMGYGRDDHAAAAEYNFLRDVDYCSGVFLLVRGAALRRLGGLDPVYAPAYYEETDLCARLWQSGLRVVYDPSVALVHLEFGSSRNPDAPRAQMQRNREIFVERHRAWLSTRLAPDPGLALRGRIAPRTPRQRHILVIEDTIPYRHLGSGFVRSADVVASLVSLGWQVTVFPMNPLLDPPANRREGFAETVELLWDHNVTDAPRVFAARETLYDAVWVCRAHNLHRLAAITGGDWGPLRHARVVLDTEALACNREVAEGVLHGRRLDLATLLKREMALAHLAHEVVTVNRQEAAQLSAIGVSQVRVLGHTMPLCPTDRGFADRADILAVGSLYAEGTPNFDGLRWFLDEVWPLVKAALPGVRLLVAGFVAEGLDAAALLSGPDVVHLGYVEDLRGLYDLARVFVAPTRFSAGIPYKVHEAAAHGLPVVATERLAEQLGWTAGTDLLAQDPFDPAGFAAAVVSAYRDPVQWHALRHAALARITNECDRQAFTEVVAAALAAA